MAKTHASPLDWSHATSEIRDSGFKRERAATPDECAAIIAALGLLGASNISAAYRIERLAGAGYRLSGSVTASIAQACIVSLEPVNDDIDDTFDVEFWPEVDAGDASQDARVLEGRDVEKLERGEIPVGRIVFETISAALDPYPRKAGAEFDWQDPKTGEGPAKISPFAALAKLKDKS